MRECSTCGKFKEDSVKLFYRRCKNSNTGMCRKCKNKSDKKYRDNNKEKVAQGRKEHRLNNLEKIKQYKKSHFQNNKDHYRRYTAEYKKNFNYKLQAKDKVAHALRKGELKKEPCLACQVQDKKINNVNIDGHHTDYDRPLNVVWLCRNHHRQVHKLMNNNNL